MPEKRPYLSNKICAQKGHLFTKYHILDMLGLHIQHFLDSNYFILIFFYFFTSLEKFSSCP